MPPIIGYSKMANFHVLSLPGPGTVVLGIAWLLGPVAPGWSGARPARVGRDGGSGGGCLT